MTEIGQFTHDIRFIEGKANVFADMLSRPFDVPIGEAYKMPETITTIGSDTQVSALSLNEVSLETFSAENLQKEQENCPDVLNHKKGNLPRFVNMADIEMKSGVTLYCEISGDKGRPLLPAKLRTRVLNAFHALDHCGQKELLRRTASEYYWPNQSTDVSKFAANCHPCQLVKTGRIIKESTT